MLNEQHLPDFRQSERGVHDASVADEDVQRRLSEGLGECRNRRQIL
jgi:hypothetical protein